jgi:hypothetical protein
MPKKTKPITTNLEKAHLNDGHPSNVPGCKICEDRKAEDNPQSITESQLNIPPEPKVGFEPHDAVQIIEKSHKRYAQLAILHTINGPNAILYQPRTGMKPESFVAKLTELHRIGPAKLKYRAELK